MNWDSVKLLYRHELKMLLRARRTVVMAIVIPAVVMPLMLFAGKVTHDRQERAEADTTYVYAVSGRLAERVRNMIATAKSELDKQSGEDGEVLREFKYREAAV